MKSVRTWALVAVAITTSAMLYFAWWLISILSAPDWCARAINASRESERPESAITGCYGLLMRQVEALALNSHLAIGVLALCLAVLVVIVLAGGQLSLKAGASGIEADIHADDDVIRDGDAVKVEKE